MVEATQDRDGDDGRGRVRLPYLFYRLGDRLPNALMRPRRIEVGAVCSQHPEQLALVQDEEMVEALPPHATEEPLADGVRAGCAYGRPQHLDAAPRRNTGELRFKLGVVVADQEARRDAKGRGFAHLLGDPCVGWVLRDANVNNPT